MILVSVSGLFPAYLPGFINGYVHALTALSMGTLGGFGFENRTASEDIALCGVVTPEIMLAASRLVPVETLRSGVTLASFTSGTDAFEQCRRSAEVLGRAEMEACLQTTVAGIFGPTGLTAEARLTEADLLLREYHGR